MFWKAIWSQNDSFFNSSENMIHEIMTWKNEKHVFLSDIFELITEITYIFFMKTFSFALIIIVCCILL